MPEKRTREAPGIGAPTVTLHHDLKLICPSCRAESRHPLTIKEGMRGEKMFGPLTPQIVRDGQGPRRVWLIPVTCPACGLVSLFDAKMTVAPAEVRELEDIKDDAKRRMRHEVSEEIMGRRPLAGDGAPPDVR